MALIRSSGIGIAGLDEVVADVRVHREVKDKFDPILNVYRYMLGLPASEVQTFVSDLHYSVNSNDINLFLEMTKPYITHPNYNGYEGYTGLFMSQLMTNVIQSGCTKFMLNMTELPALNKMCYKLTAPHDKKLDITIQGAIGFWCLYNINATGIIKIEKARENFLGETKFEGDVIIGAADELCLINSSVHNIYTPNRWLYTRLLKQTHISLSRGKVHLIPVEEFERRMKE